MGFVRILFLLFSTVSIGFAQAPELPAMNIVTENAKNILSWTNQFDGVKTIAVQRSLDSVRNFVTIGILNAPKKGVGTYTDDRPLPGKNHYRLSIGFAGDLEWYSNVYKVLLDSALIAKSNLGAIETGSTNSSNYTDTKAAVTDFYYTPSTRIYTNPYTGHINITLNDALSKKYSIRFYDPEKTEVLRISRVSKTTLILDKNNFNSRGTYNFKLFEGSSLVETGFITIY
ncbi:MAG: hypothetical protein IPK62_02325 [Bacteroidetes bacterium]|nr:hypothetical protein [Bacteroidota bacterium]